MTHSTISSVLACNYMAAAVGSGIGYELTFLDASGKVIGLVTTNPMPPTYKPGYVGGCTETNTSTYRIHLPKEDFYQVQVAGVSGTVRKSYADLQQTGFALDLNAGTDTV